MANSYSTQDIVKGVLQRCGENTDGSSQYHELALKYVNATNLCVLSGSSEFDVDVGQPWTWARTESYTQLPAFYNTGYVSLTLGSTAGSFSVAPTVSVQGYFLNAIGFPNYYPIASHTANSTSFTLAAPCLEATATNYAFNAIPLIVDLGPGILRLVEPMRIDVERTLEYLEDAQDMGRIYGMGIDQFRKEYPFYQLMNDIPTKFTVISESESSVKIMFNRYVTNPIKLTYDSIKIPNELQDTSTSIPQIPRNFRKVLEYGASHFLLTDKKDVTGSQYYYNLTQKTLMAMVAAEKKRAKLISNDYGTLTPRLDDTAIPYWLIIR